ncbi:unnamed protein product [Caenorhabditis brenneri]
MDENKIINKKNKKKINVFQKLVEDSIKAGGIWSAEPSKLNRDEKREDDTGSAKSNKNHWNKKWWN